MQADFDRTIGIHPTDAESFMGLTVTKRSGESWVASGISYFQVSKLKTFTKILVADKKL